MNSYLFTSESVTEGHPDKLCDTISDQILDAYLEQDETARVAVETFASKDLIVVAGQVTSNAVVDIEKLVRETIKQIGYDNAQTGIDYRTCKVIVNLTKQSKGIAMGVDLGGAGDQGIMFGFACDETKEYMPLSIMLAHKLAKRLTQVRKEKVLSFLRPDGKTQVTIEYENQKPKRIESILISSQHSKEVTKKELTEVLTKEVIKQVIDGHWIDENTKIFINPTGEFLVGGPLADTGLTGRKIMVDTYGGYSRHGGGAFSGKDATKVDRSASYFLRYVAKNIVANGYAKKCELQIAYAIGQKQPLSLFLNTFDTNCIREEEILEKIKNKFDFTPEGIITMLNLRKPIYAQTTNYGHFGKLDTTWEQIIKI